ncbi:MULTISPECIES: hypothetical protein [Paenibacillus]|uniref:hypothetical protein n=1 Tax=Paenibacillus TaxID=44249 RepID=UPI0022B87EC2|nr:hypothetical protein [Paenibacillus caseinilyticus]MCZ8519754.1 hypothetical protein [Paenibacillus caseinilyticus]
MTNTQQYDQNTRIRNGVREAALHHPVIREFASKLEHAQLIETFLIHPSPDSERQLNDTFRRFFFRLRFTKYLASLIRFSHVEFMRSHLKHTERQPLVLDQPTGGREEGTLADLLLTTDMELDGDVATRHPQRFQMSLKDERLYEAFSRLTPKQQLVITLAYSWSAGDREIANGLRVSQQAVSKARNTALKHMRRFMTASGGGPAGTGDKDRGGGTCR